MKTSNRLRCCILLTLFISFITIGCSKESNHNPDNISLTVGNKTLQSSRIDGTSNGTDLALDGYPISQGDTSLVHIVMLTNIKAGQPDSFQLSSVWYTTGNGVTYSSDAIHGGHGILTVSSWDSTGGRVAGTFNGVFYNTTTGSDSLIVTNGHFNSGYHTF